MATERGVAIVTGGIGKCIRRLSSRNRHPFNISQCVHVEL